MIMLRGKEPHDLSPVMAFIAFSRTACMFFRPANVSAEREYSRKSLVNMTMNWMNGCMANIIITAYATVLHFGAESRSTFLMP